MESLWILIGLFITLQPSFSYHDFNFQPLKRNPSRRQAPGFMWDDSNFQFGTNNNFNNNNRNFDRDRIFFDNYDDFPMRPPENIRPWNRPSRPWNNVNPTPSPIEASTVAIPGMGTTRSPCEDACQVTREYNPVCGTNGITYTNDRWLKCAQRCGRQVSISYYGACPRIGQKTD